MRTAKSCGPDIPTLISGATRERCHPRRQISPVSGASTKDTVKTIRAGNAGRLRCDRGDFACVLFHFAHKATGAVRAPGIPCALQRAKFGTSLGADFACGNAKVWLFEN